MRDLPGLVAVALAGLSVLAVLRLPVAPHSPQEVPLQAEPSPEPVPAVAPVEDYFLAAFSVSPTAIAFYHHGRPMLVVHDQETSSAATVVEGFPDAMVEIWPSGRVEFAEDYRVQAPAEAFWSAIARLRLGDCGPLAYRALVFHARAEQDVARSLRDLTAAKPSWQPPRADLIEQANRIGSEALVCLRSVGVTP